MSLEFNRRSFLKYSAAAAVAVAGSSLPDYASFDSRDCPMCKAGQHIDALVNSFGYSAL